MLCGILLIAEGALNLGCILYAAMELRTLDRMASAATNAALGAIGDALDEAEAAERDAYSRAIVMTIGSFILIHLAIFYVVCAKRHTILLIV